jgi:branched-chain amino acid transport system substrate-binding protein
MPRYLALAAATLATILTTSACGAPGKSDDAKDSGSGPIKIAVIDAQSGQLSSVGAWESKGA